MNSSKAEHPGPAPTGGWEEPIDERGGFPILLYRYRGTNPQHQENVGLRQAMHRQVPLAYFHGIVPGRYLAVWPVFIVGDDSRALTFRVAVDDAGLTHEAVRGRGPPADVA